MAIRRRHKPRHWGWLPSKSEWAKLGAGLVILGGYWDARVHPDAKSRDDEAGLAAYSVQLEARVTALEEQVQRLRVTRRLRHGGSEAKPAVHRSPKPHGFFYAVAHFIAGKPEGDE